MSGPLPDGEYPSFVIDVEDHPDGRRGVELTIVSGEHKGEVLTVVASGIEGDFTDLIGMPATLVVAGGEPRVTIDD